MATTGFRKFSPILSFVLIGFAFSLSPNGRAASVANVETHVGEPIQIVYGTDVTITTMNYFDTAFEEDPLNPGLPAPTVHEAASSGSLAHAMNDPSPGQAGVARAKIGILYDLLPGNATWDEIKDIPLDVIVNFEYTVEAQYTNGEGSANAGLGISPFTSPWYDFLGSETGETGSRTETVSVSYVTTFDLLGDKTFLEVYSQAHLTPGGSNSFSQSQVTVTSITFDFAPLPPDLRVDAIEVTQAVQDLNNSVRLVAGKRTFVRLHVSSAGNTYRTFAHLEITVGGNTYPIYPSTPGYEVYVRKTPNRGVPTHAFLFEIPVLLTFAGEMEIEAFLNPETDWRDHNPVELTYANNTLSTTVNFEDVPPVNLLLHQIVYTLNGAGHVPGFMHAQKLPDWMKRAFPLSDLNVWHRVTHYSEAATVDAKGNLTTPSCEQINALLLRLRRWDSVYGAGNIPATAHYYGMVSDGGGYMRGCADLPGYAASGPAGDPAGKFSWDTDGSYGDWYGAHELAHSYGRGHANFCGAVGGPAYPYPEGRISPVTSGNTALFGFDINTRAIYNPFWEDVMTYCNHQWIGDFTYEALMTTFQTPLALGPISEGGPGDYLSISGFLNLETDEISIDPIFLLEDVTNPLPSTPGDYAIVLRNSSGEELATYPFTPLTGETGVPNPDDPGDEQHFLMIDEMVPNVAGTEFVDISGLEGVLTTITAGATPPSVTLLTPNGGEIPPGPEVTVIWNGDDPDGDPLQYHLQYSRDAGATWSTVAMNVISETVTISNMNLPASGTALFRVWASDGLHSASDASDATFGIPNHPPIAFIEEPTSDITVVEHETVSFRGFAYDIEAGTPGPGMISWTSNLDGILDVRPEYSTSDLSMGVHTITFKVEDGEGGMMMDTVIVTVVGDPTMAPPPDNKLVAGPSLIDLGSVTTPVTATLYIENQNLDNTLTWDATASESWLSLSALTGMTSAEITLSIVDTGLIPGLNTATITLTSDELPGESVVIFVQIFKEELGSNQVFLPVVKR